MNRGISGHHSPSSKTVDWLTPPEWIDALGPFDLDPCASVDQPWRTATEQWTEAGLDRPWHGLVWMNPPYGPPKVIEPWMKATVAHNNAIACIFARTETACWQQYVWPRASAILFVKGRPHFHHAVSGDRARANSGGPVALVGYGLEAALRLGAGRIHGRLVIGSIEI